MTPVRRTFGWYVARVIIYLLLIAFGLFMLFPFIYMVSTSLKVSSDVFHYPPRLLPYTAREITMPDGSTQPVYLVDVNGTQRQMLLTDDKLPHVFFTTEDKINANDKRASEIVIALPRDDVDAGAATAA